MKLPQTIAEEVAKAFAHTFWWAVAIILIAFIPTLFLPHTAPCLKRGAQRVGRFGIAGGDGDDADGGDDVPPSGHVVIWSRGRAQAESGPNSGTSSGTGNSVTGVRLDLS